MKRRILLVDDEIAVLLTLKAVLEISGFDVDTATSGLEGRHKLRAKQYDMVITDMRMEHEQAGRDVVGFARGQRNPPAIALLTAFPVADDDWQQMGADKMLVKPMHTRVLLEQIEALFEKHQTRTGTSASTVRKATEGAGKKAAAKSGKSVRKPAASVKKASKKAVAKKAATRPAKSAKKATVKPKAASQKATGRAAVKGAKKATAKKTAKKR
jgi:DNA-binding response OmpR family regulator